MEGDIYAESKKADVEVYQKVNVVIQLGHQF